MSLQQRVQLIDPNRILVVGAHGGLRQLYTPFRVRCIEPVETFRPGTIYYVERAFKHPRLLITFWINQRLVPYHCFEILINW